MAKYLAQAIEIMLMPVHLQAIIQMTVTVESMSMTFVDTITGAGVHLVQLVDTSIDACIISNSAILS